jgi:CheY-like chemotaxis protein
MPRILLIDDDETLRSALRRSLERAGYDTLEAADGRAALKLLTGDQVDVIITDLVMPEMEGIELIVSLRKSHPTVPVIAISGGGRTNSPQYLKIARGVGAARVLAKPFENEQLLEAVRELVDES